MPFISILSVTTFALAMAWSTQAAFADDAALYENALPADAVFVRVLAGTNEPPTEIEFGGAQLSITSETLDTYSAISAADLTGVAAGGYYSLVDGQSGPVAIQEPGRDTLAKVHLIVLNTGPEPVRLIVPSKGLEVVAHIDAGQAGGRAVNPIEIDLAVERVRDGARLGTFDVRLARGQNLTFVAGETSARLIENRLGGVLNPN